VTIGETTFDLDEPFMVLATQNPIEQEGTYPLPEAQLDRFLLKVVVGYPSMDEEREIVRRMARSAPITEVVPAVHPAEILALRSLCDAVYLDARVEDYILHLVQATRSPDPYGLDLNDVIRYGASPRAAIALTMASRAHAFLNGRGYVVPHDVKSVAVEVLRHRIILTYEAQVDERTPDDVIRQILATVRVP
jgi:MoxR-like ATPase